MYHFAHVFQQAHGLTPMNYLRRDVAELEVAVHVRKHVVDAPAHAPLELLPRGWPRLVQPLGEPRPRALLGEQARDQEQVLLLEPGFIALPGLDVVADVAQHRRDAMIVHAQVLGEFDLCGGGLGTVIQRRAE